MRSAPSVVSPNIASGHRWVQTSDGPLMTWTTAPVDQRSGSGVLILPPIGYQWWSTHRTLRTIAERLAAAGHRVARLDYPGTGDSAGDQWDGDRVGAWRGSVGAAVADLRAQGCTSVSVVGVRLGATFAVLDGAALGLDALALWAPVVNGRRWAREVKMLAEAVPEERDPFGGGTMVASGVVFSAQTMSDIGALSATAADLAPANRVLLIDARPDTGLVDHLAGLGCAVEAAEVEGGDRALEVASEDAVVPDAIVDGIVDWLGPAPAIAEPAVAISWRGAVVEETVTHLGDAGLTAVIARTGDVPPTGTTLLFLNTGSEPHVGPGRTWVELGRTLAAAGHVCVRADWRGWGESPDGGRVAPGRPYDQHAVDDTVELIRALRADGHKRIALVGLCASAWIALRAVLQAPVAAVVAINPQLYWQPGDPVEATLEQTRRRRTQEIADIAAGAADGRWDAEDDAGDRPWAGQWLDDLTATGVPVTLLFAEGDDGIEFLTTRHARRLADAQASGLVVRELPDIDHPLHRAWTRDVAADAIAAAIEREPTDPQIASR